MVERADQVLHALPRRRRAGDDGGSGKARVLEPAAYFQGSRLDGWLVHEISLGQSNHRAVGAEHVDDLEVLLRLGLPSLVGGDDEQNESHRSYPGQHVPNESLVARDVHESDLLTGRERGPSESEVDREASSLLLGQTVWIHSGEPEDQRGLAVVDVSGRGHDLKGSSGLGVP
jgi:hypothetical protein